MVGGRRPSSCRISDTEIGRQAGARGLMLGFGSMSGSGQMANGAEKKSSSGLGRETFGTGRRLASRRKVWCRSGA
jgi:hypothetical protein